MTEPQDSNRERAIHALTHDVDGTYTGNDRVPCSRWGTTGAECAEVAYDLDTLLVELGCDPSTPESLEHAMSLVVNDHDDVATVFREHGSVELRERYAEQLGTDERHLAHARYLGADAALTSVLDHYMMSEADARSILDDVDPEVLDRYREPNLSGEWADEPTPVDIAREVGANDGDLAFYGRELIDEIADAWEEGRDAVWGDALQATALRVLGEIARALEVEAANEAIVASYRKAAGL